MRLARDIFCHFLKINTLLEPKLTIIMGGGMGGGWGGGGGDVWNIWFSL